MTVATAITVAAGDRDKLRDLALDYLGGGPLDGVEVAHVRQLLIDLDETGSGPIEFSVKEPDALRRALKKLRETADFQGETSGVKACDRVLSSLDEGRAS